MSPDDFKKRLAEDYIYQAILDFADGIFASYNFAAVYNMIKDLEEILKERPDFSRKHPERYQDYRQIIVKAKFIALAQIGEDKAVDLFSGHWREMFELDDYDLFERFRSALLNIAAYKERDKFKQRVKRALLSNKQVISSQKIEIKIGTDVKELEPTVGNWLDNYNKEVGGGNVNKIVQADYISNNRNIKQLKGREKDRVVLLLKFYEYLKISTMVDEGVEEKPLIIVDGKLKIFNRGQLEDIPSEVDELYNKVVKMEKESEVESRKKEKTEKLDQENKKSFNAAQDGPKKQKNNLQLSQEVKSIKQLMREVLIGDKKEEEEVKKLEVEKTEVENLELEIGKLTALARKEIKKFVPSGAGGLGNKKIKRLETIALLRAAARRGSGGLSKSDFQKSIKNILGEKLGLPESEQARYAMQLALILKKRGESQFMQSVYFDKRANIFAWNKI